MTDSTTQSPSLGMEIYHWPEIIPIGRRLDPKPRLFYVLISLTRILGERLTVFLTVGKPIQTGKCRF
jgi:hypothetical protein